MSKTKAASNSGAASPQQATQKPYMVQVFGPTTLAMQEVAVHIRAGYTPCIHTPIEIFPAAGTISLTLVLGSPEQAFVEAAARTSADAVAIEQARYNRDVEQAAERMIEAKARAVAEAKRAAMIAEQKAALLALEEKLAAEAAAEVAVAQ